MSEMTIDEWKRRAKVRLLSGEMGEEEWSKVLDALLFVSENDGIELFDQAVDPDAEGYDE